MKQSIQKLVDAVESMENDVAQGKGLGNIPATAETTMQMIHLASANPSNNEYEPLLDDLGNRIGMLLLKL